MAQKEPAKRHDGLKLLDRMMGKLIAGMREYHDISPEALSSLIGCSPNEIRRWEAGEQPVDLPILWLMAETLGFQTEYFTNGLRLSVEANGWSLEACSAAMDHPENAGI